jgi:hypothetical protein
MRLPGIKWLPTNIGPCTLSVIMQERDHRYQFAADFIESTNTVHSPYICQHNNKNEFSNMVFGRIISRVRVKSEACLSARSLTLPILRIVIM